MAMDVPNSNADTLRTLADKFREKYPKNGIAVLTSGGMIISVVTEDLVKRGLKAGDLIAAIGGRGGGRPNLAQGSLPDPALMSDAHRQSIQDRGRETRIKTPPINVEATIMRGFLSRLSLNEKCRPGCSFISHGRILRAAYPMAGVLLG